jgi:excisionase family DNA binding protein
MYLKEQLTKALAAYESGDIVTLPYDVLYKWLTKDESVIRDYLTVSDIAGLERRSPDTVRRWCRQGRIRATKNGKDYAVSKSDYAAFKDNPPLLVKVTKKGRVTKAKLSDWRRS